MAVTVVLAHPLSAGDAARLGIPAQDYHVGASISVPDHVRDVLDGNGMIQHDVDDPPPPLDILPPGTVQLADLAQEVLDAITGDAAAVPDATTSVKGIVRLAGDLAGTAAAPIVVKVNGVTVPSGPTTGQVLTASNGTTATWATPATGSAAPDATTTIKGVVQLAGDLAGTAAAPRVAKVNGVTVTGTPASGQVPVASSTTAAAWAAVPAPTDATTSLKGIVQLAGDLAGTSTVPTVPALAARARTSSGGLEDVNTVASSGASQTLNLNAGNVHVVTLTANCTLTFAGATNGKACSATWILKQDATGGRAVTWPASFKWAGATAPTLSTAANKTDIVTLFTVDGGTTVYAFAAGLGF